MPYASASKGVGKILNRFTHIYIYESDVYSFFIKSIGFQKGFYSTENQIGYYGNKTIKISRRTYLQ